MGFAVVFFGAGIGGMLRHAVNLLAARLVGTGLPVGTFAVNVIGSFAMGLLAGLWMQRAGLPEPLRLFLTTGVLGGFTTFSAFALDTASLWERGMSLAAAIYVVASVLLSLAAVLAGLMIVRALMPGQG